MLNQLKQSRFAVQLHIIAGIALMMLAMYPILSSAQTTREKMQERKGGVVENMEEAREARQQKVDEAREAMQERLKAITDERKAQLAQQLADQMNALNERLTNHYVNFLTHLETVLGKIEARLAEAGSEVNTADVQAKIAAAKAKITAAKGSVATQAAKVYTVTFTSEAKLREAFQGVKKQLQDDHAAMRAILADAKESVREAFQALNVDEAEDAE